MAILNRTTLYIFSICLLTTSLFSRKTPSASEIITDKNPLKILTPSLKDIQTKKLILSNDIKVFLISDKMARKSAAAVTVNVGSWHNPDEDLGMAHFCEHMLFMGSKKYPDENGFHKYIQDNGGMTNAYTATDKTVYMYSINHEKLDTSLDMFSRFFIDPLFSESSVGRELLAINQEHKKNLENDGWRQWFIFKQEGNQNHPNARFSTGTEETLKYTSRDKLEAWFKKHYKSSGMHLIVYSNQDLDSLTTMIETSFSNVEQAKEALPPTSYGKLSSSNQEGHITYIEPVKDIKNLSISWEIPPAYSNDLDKKTYELIAYALSYQMKGSLCHNLKEQGLIENLDSDCTRISNNHIILTVSMDLTSDGIQKTDHILYTFFQALNKLKKGNLPSHIYDDMKAVRATSYKWQSRQDPFKLVMNLAGMIVNEPLDTFPYKTVMITDFDQKNSRELLAFLLPQNACITVFGKQHDTHRTANKEETWTKASYSVSKISDEVLLSWGQAPPHPDIYLPNPNPFISKHQKLINEAVSPIQDPVLIVQEDSGSCYFWQDTNYLVPKTQIIMKIKSPEINSNDRSLCLNEMFASYLNYHMSSLISEGSFANINTSIYAQDLGLNFNIDGYHDKIGSFMMSFLSNLTTSYPTKQEFTLIKEQMLASCRSAQCSLPFRQGLDCINSILTNSHLDNASKEAVIESISLEQFQNFQKSILDENYLQVMITGNLDKKNAMLHYTEIKNTLSSKAYNPQNHITAAFVPFYGSKPKPMKVVVDTPMSGNSSILFIDQGHFSYEKSASQKVLGAILNEAFFTELRTKQQTGYIAISQDTEIKSQMMQCFVVQSTTHYPEELLARFELFLEDFGRSINENVTEERFKNIKTSLAQNLMIPTENMQTYSSQLFNLAYNQGAKFDKRQKTIDALQALDYNTFIQDAKEFISRENAKRLAVLINGKKTDEKSFSYSEVSAKELTAKRN
ncbi:MAG: Protease 3 [Chlamydiia bacterium]|nr:Protease 3 [Chlamydiia bacterium]